MFLGGLKIHLLYDSNSAPEKAELKQVFQVNERQNNLPNFMPSNSLPQKMSPAKSYVRLS